MMLIGSKSGKKKRSKSGKKLKGLLGTRNTLFSYFDQFLYFDHKFLISYPIYVIKVAN